MLDFVTVKVGDVDFSKKSTDSKGLLVRVAASHAATINGNYRFYRPDRMQDGVKTWVPNKGFKRPVLIGHNEDGDVLGRVIEARYVDESYKFASDFPVIKDSLFYRTDSQKVGLYESVDWIVDNLLDLEDYTGLGYIELGLNITNPEAVQKILRDEYLNVSVGFSTDKAVCSVCHQDWAADDRCEHKLGSEVDGKTAFLICGDLDYSEVSFVNFPADPFAGTISKQSLSDAVNKQFFLGQNRLHRNAAVQELAMSDSLFEADIHHVIEEDSMSKISTLDQLLAADGIKDLTAEIRTSLVKDRVTEIKALLDSWKPETDALKSKKRSLVSTLNVNIKKNKLDSVEAIVETTAVDEVNAAISITDNCDDCLADAIETFEEADRSFFDDEDGLAEEMNAELAAAVTASELTVAEGADNKLTAEGRKKLKGGSFCGPNRSFPVENKAHVVAARRLIGRAKVSSSTKSKILACVNRKAKAMGADAVAEIIIPTVSTSADKIIKMLGDKKFTDANKTLGSSFEALDAAYDAAEPDDKQTARVLLSALQSDWYADGDVAYYLGQLMKEDSKDKLTAALGEKGLVIIDKSEADDLAEKEEAINTLTVDKTTADKELAAQKLANKALLGLFKQGLAQQIVMTKVLTGHDGFKNLDAAGRKAKVDELSGRHVEYLKDTVADLLSELKWEAPTTQAVSQVIEPGKTATDNAQITVNVDTTEESEKADELFTDTFILPKLLGGKDAKMHMAARRYKSVN
jgi:hypothetical protein